MAGGFIYKNNKQKQKPGSNNEKIHESLESFAPKTDNKPSLNPLRGILNLNQKVDFQSQKNESWGHEFFKGLNHLVSEEKVLLDSKQKDIEQSIKNLRHQIQKRQKTAPVPNREIEKASMENISQPSRYHLNFFSQLLSRIPTENSSVWSDSFNSKKRKRNAFWNRVKSKSGGEQYLASGEHSASRSVN